MTHSIIKSNKLRSVIKKASVLLFWLAVWEAAALAVGRELLIASPFRVAARLTELAVTYDFWMATGMSLLRIMSGFIIGVITGVQTAAVTYRIKLLHDLLTPLLTIIRVTPIASFIILTLVWIENGSVPVFISFLMVLPIVWSGVTAGLESVDRSLAEVAVMYGFSPFKKLTRLYIPSVMPFFRTAVINAVGLAWKTGVAAEVLCTPVFSIGRQLYESKLYLETTDLFAWTVALILISLVIEKLIHNAMNITEAKH
jgi:NitT/TauT family transport system permease protein